jgi:hypothetical protein
MLVLDLAIAGLAAFIAMMFVDVIKNLIKGE